jgi:vacuolar-type H+-ATPase subunit I/STV1
MSHKMSHLQIIGLKFDLEATIHTLGELGCIHIDDVSETPELSITPLTIDAAMVRKQEELSLKLLQVNGIIDILGFNNKLAAESLPPNDGSGERLLQEVSNLVPRVQALANRREKLHAEQELLPRFLDTLRKLMPLFLSLARDPSYVSFGLLVNRDHTEVLDTIAHHVDSITEGRAQTPYVHGRRQHDARPARCLAAAAASRIRQRIAGCGHCLAVQPAERDSRR